MSKEPPPPSTCRHLSAAHTALIQPGHVLFSDAHTFAMFKLIYSSMLLRRTLLLLHAVALHVDALHAAVLHAAVLRAVMLLCVCQTEGFPAGLSDWQWCYRQLHRQHQHLLIVQQLASHPPNSGCQPDRIQLWNPNQSNR